MNIEQALHILGGEFAKCSINRNRAFSKRENGGISICFHYSKLYEKCKWWTSESFLIVDSFNYIIVALQNCGILALPCKLVKDYWHELNVSALKNGNRNIYIKEDAGKIVLYNRSNQHFVNVTEHLHPCVVTE